MRRSLLFVAGLLGTVVFALPGASAAAAASTQVIAVVIDFGTGAGARGALVTCVHEHAGASSGQALNDALTEAHLTVASYSSSGLLCAIDGYPSAGCGTPTSAGYQYWAYFHGDASGWHYAQDGPNERQATPSLSEGWRFEDTGKGNPSDPPPPQSADPSRLCVRPVTTTTASLITTTTMPPPAPASVTTTPGHAALPTRTTMTSQANTHHVSSTTTTIRGRVMAASNAAKPGASSSSGPPAATIVALVLVGVGGTVGLFVWRRRRA